MAKATKQQTDLVQALFEEMYLHNERVCGTGYHELDNISYETYLAIKQELMNSYYNIHKENDTKPASIAQVTELKQHYADMLLTEFDGKTADDLDGITVNEAKKILYLLKEYGLPPLEIDVKHTKDVTPEQIARVDQLAAELVSVMERVCQSIKVKSCSTTFDKASEGIARLEALVDKCVILLNEMKP